jgi:hypothetical protein
MPGNEVARHADTDPGSRGLLDRGSLGGLRTEPYRPLVLLSHSTSIQSQARKDSCAVTLLCLVQTHGDIVREVFALACQEMRWPGMQTQIRAVAVCPTVAAAAGFPPNPVGSQASSATSAVDMNS